MESRTSTEKDGTPANGSRDGILRGPRLSALDSWLAQHPTAHVAALGMDALGTAMPAEITLGADHVLDSRSLLDLIMVEDRAQVATGFVTARRTGQGVAYARLIDGGSELAIHYMDLAPDLPIILRMSLDGQLEHSVPAAPDRAPVRARAGIITKDEAGRILALDDGARELLIWRPDEVIGTSALAFIHPDDHDRALENWFSMHLGGGSHVVRIRYRRGNGDWIWLDTSNSYDRTTGSVTCQVTDASREMAASDRLRRSEQLLRRLTETVPVGLCFLSPDRMVSHLNPGLAELLGTAQVADLEALQRCLGGDQPRSLAACASAALDDGLDGEIEVTLHRDGRVAVRARVTISAVVDRGEVTGALVCVVDVTELKRMATTDPLTGLLNRQAILEALRSALAVANGLTGLLFLDLDQFKPVNDVYGHRVGDQLLVATAARLRGAVRACDQVGRLGGDEFIVVCPSLLEPADLESVAYRIGNCMKDPLRLDDNVVTLGVSIGMAIAEGTRETPQLILDRADSAMYEAKRRMGGPAWAEPALLRPEQDATASSSGRNS